MSLTSEEQRQLEVIEYRLSAEDPQLARLLANQTGPRARGRTRRPGRKWLTMAIVAAVGATMLIVGAVLQMAVLASVGLVIAAFAPTALCLQLRGRPRRRPKWGQRERRRRDWDRGSGWGWS